MAAPGPEDETVDLGPPTDLTNRTELLPPVAAPRSRRAIPRNRRPRATTVAAAIFALAALALFLLLVSFELGKSN